MITKLRRAWRRWRALERARDLEAAAKLFKAHGMLQEAREMDLLAGVHRAVAEELR
jgi:hypothetical protein